MFKFLSTEDNDASAGGDLTVPLSKGSFKIAVDVGEKKQRKGERSIKISDDFKELRNLKKCHEPGAIPKESWKYPITGTIGLHEVIFNFIHLAQGQEALSDLEDYSDNVGTIYLTERGRNSILMVKEKRHDLQSYRSGFSRRSQSPRFFRVRALA